MKFLHNPRNWSGWLTGCLLLVAIVTRGQSRPGTWQEYFSYSNAIKVADGGDKLFCATVGGLFYVDLSDNSLNKLTSGDGLSDAGVQTMEWNPAAQMLLVAYDNSNVDLVYKNRVVNVSDIRRKQITGDKTIYNILFDGDEAFLACGFGIVAINLQKNEVKGTYVLGESGNSIRVFDVATDGNSLFAATEKGIMTAPRNHPNLLDYRNWSRLETVPRSTGKFSCLAMAGTHLMAVYSSGLYAGDEAYLLSGTEWQRIIPEVTYFNDLIVNAGYLVATSYEEVFIYDLSFSLKGRIKDYQLGATTIWPIRTRSALVTTDGSLWIADYTSGLIRLKGQTFEQNLPPGPLNNDVFSLTTSGKSLWVAGGGRTDPWNNQFKQPVFQQMEENLWTYYTSKEIPEMTGFWDIVQIAADPQDAGHIFAASWGGGLLEFRGNQMVNRYNNLNSPLQTALPEKPGDPYTRIGGMAFDRNNTLWITNSQSSKGLHSLNTKGQWNSYELPEVSGMEFTIGQVIVTSNNDKWVVIPRGKDVYVVDETAAHARYLPVTSYFSNGDQEILNRMNDVYSIAEDLDGDIWIGTSKGVAVFSNPGRVWKEDIYYAFQPSLEMNDGIYHPLLETEIVTAIAVDGDNRKWLGTRNSGIYLVSARGDREVLHFTAENSKLISNSISSLAFNKATGELFIGTDKGLVSYMGNAPAGRENLAEVYAFPNPVRETYSGDITVAGLMKDTDVRITDIAGNLVFKGKSLGSKLLWDGKNLNGRRVSTGVYLIFCSDKSGYETRIAKLLVIH